MHDTAFTGETHRALPLPQGRRGLGDGRSALPRRRRSESWCSGRRGTVRGHDRRLKGPGPFEGRDEDNAFLLLAAHPQRTSRACPSHAGLHVVDNSLGPFRPRPMTGAPVAVSDTGARPARPRPYAASSPGGPAGNGHLPGLRTGCLDGTQAADWTAPATVAGAAELLVFTGGAGGRGVRAAAVTGRPRTAAGAWMSWHGSAPSCGLRPRRRLPLRLGPRIATTTSSAPPCRHRRSRPSTGSRNGRSPVRRRRVRCRTGSVGRSSVGYPLAGRQCEGQEAWVTLPAFAVDVEGSSVRHLPVHWLMK